MKDKLKFLRTFMIFEQEDKGYGIGQGPSGHIKIEVRSGKGKLVASVQNLKEDKDTFNYRLYILRYKGGKVVPVKVGIIPLKQGRGEIKWEFDPYDVGGTGNSIDGFTAATVLVESYKRRNTAVICPLAAYKDEKVEWRQQLKTELYNTGTEENKEEIVKRQDAFSKYEGGLESKYNASEEESQAREAEIEDKANDSKTEEHADIMKEEDTEVEEEINEEMGNCGKEFCEEREEISKENGQENKPIDDNEVKYKNMEKYSNECMFKNNSYCGINLDKTNFNPCESCYMINSKKQVDETQKGEGDIERLKAELDKNFQNYDPFHTRRRDYRWWKLSSPVQLNNILYQCNIKTPLLFNPAVMMAHFKYRHLIVGIYTDRVRDNEYIVCGIPGVYRVDDKPFGDMCRWVQLEGRHPRYGVFGYWLVYIDPKSGSILSLK